MPRAGPGTEPTPPRPRPGSEVGGVAEEGAQRAARQLRSAPTNSAPTAHAPPAHSSEPERTLGYFWAPSATSLACLCSVHHSLNQMACSSLHLLQGIIYAAVPPLHQAGHTVRLGHCQASARRGLQLRDGFTFPHTFLAQNIELQLLF